MKKVSRELVHQAYRNWCRVHEHVPMRNNSWIEFWGFLGDDPIPSWQPSDNPYYYIHDETEPKLHQLAGPYYEVLIKAHYAAKLNEELDAKG